MEASAVCCESPSRAVVDGSMDKRHDDDDGRCVCDAMMMKQQQRTNQSHYRADVVGVVV